MEKHACLLLSFFLFLSVSLSESCPNVEPVCGIDMKRFSGIWFEIARKPCYMEGDKFLGHPYSCVTHQYTELPNDHYEVFINARKGSPSGEFVHEIYEVNPDTSCNGTLAVVSKWPFQGAYQVLYVDVTYSHSLLYSCNSVLGVKTEGLWVFSRSPELADEVKANLLATATAKGISIDDLNHLVQDGCWRKSVDVSFI
eukprot:GILK01010480.1.p1 GENE.GILK01010480.1~~GILK01010480.1.p1  ORF type:complete len:209 (-),score=0.65 GILK01010480.1:149-742(-)